MADVPPAMYPCTLDLTSLLADTGGRPRLNQRALHPEVQRRHPIFHTDQLPMFTTDQLAGLPPRRLRGGELTTGHRDLAATAQQTITAALAGFVDRHRTAQDRRLCLAGGVAENSVAAGVIAATGQFDDIYLAPACGDAGTALGAALLVAAQHGHRPDRLIHTQLGPSFTDGQIADVLRDCGVRYTETSDPAADAAQLIARTADRGVVPGPDGVRATRARRPLTPRRPDACPGQPGQTPRTVPAVRPVRPRRTPARPVRHCGERAVHVVHPADQEPAPIIAATHVDGTSRPHTVPDDGTLLAGYGVAAVLASSFASRLADTRPRRATGLASAGFVLTLLGVWLVPPLLTPLFGVVLLVLWGAEFAALAVLTSLAVLRHSAGPHADTVNAVIGVTFQVGVMAGAAIGAAVVAIGHTGLLPASAAVGGGVLLTVLCAGRAFGSAAALSQKTPQPAAHLSQRNEPSPPTKG